jgi:hypothetical protein
MRSLRAATDFYLYSNLHMTLCALALTANTGLLLELNIPVFVYLCIGSSTFFLYNIQRLYASWNLADVEKHTTERHFWIAKNRIALTALTVLSIATGIVGCINWYQQVFHENFFSDFIFLLGIPALISLAYALPFIPFKKRWLRLRDLPFIKIFLIAFVWAWVTVIIPERLALKTIHIAMPEVLFSEGTSWFWASFSFLLALTIPFDIRDIRIDGADLKVLPVVLGVRGAKWLSVCLLLLASAIWFYGLIQNNIVGSDKAFFSLIALILWASISGIVVSFASPKRHEYYFSLLVDGLLLVLWFFVWIALQFV